jgi:hypothetical protein
MILTGPGLSSDLSKILIVLYLFVRTTFENKNPVFSKMKLLNRTISIICKLPINRYFIFVTYHYICSIKIAKADITEA